MTELHLNQSTYQLTTLKGRGARAAPVGASSGKRKRHFLPQAKTTQLRANSRGTPSTGGDLPKV